MPESMNLDALIESLDRDDLEVMARGWLFAANAIARYWPDNDVYGVDAITQWEELRTDIESHVPAGLPSLKQKDRTRETANYYRAVFGMPLLDENGDELGCPTCGTPLDRPTTYDYICPFCTQTERENHHGS